MSVHADSPRFLHLAAVALLSAATLGYEVVLTRLLAIVQWHHFAYMVIASALLGIGASGTFLLVFGSRIRLAIEPFLAAAALAFAVAAPLCFALAQRIPFNVLELPWTLRPFGWLFAIELLLALPFFLAATGIGRALVAFGDRLSRVYAADLVGAGLGAVAAVGLLYWLPPERTLDGLTAMAALAAGLAALGAAQILRRFLMLPAAGLLLLAIVGTGWVELRISPFKPLPQALRVDGAVLAETGFDALGLVSAVENDTVPLRWAPGLSLLAREPVPEQVALFVDAGGPIAITRYRERERPPAFLDGLTSALPYRLLDRPRVLALEPQGGGPVLQALGAGADSVDAVEIRPHVAALIRDRYGTYSGNLYRDPRVRLHVGDPRSFVESVPRGSWDLIQVSALGASPSGLDALREERLLSRESLQAMLTRLAPDGLLAITGWAQLPPRGGARLLATALQALDAEGGGAAGDRLAWIRSWNTTTLVLARSALTSAQVEAVRDFAAERAFDVIHVPGMADSEANRFNVLDRPWFREVAKGLIGPERDAFVEGYKFDIRPATDDRPYLWSFFRWGHAAEILALSREGGIGLLAVGYLALPATLLQAAVLSSLLILLPLAFLRRQSGGGARRGPALGAFACLGLAFLLTEIAFVSLFTVLLSHPVHALAVVLASFLVFAGAGSWIAGRRRDRHSISGPVAGIVGVSVLYAGALPLLTGWLLGASPAGKILATVALVAPIATLMGMPFPRTLARLRRLDPALVPWAWGANGCASVIGAVLAMLLAIHFGQRFAILSAAVLYVLAALAASRMERPDGHGAES